MINITNQLNKMNQNDTALMLFAMLIIIIAMTLYVISLKRRNNKYKEWVNFYAGGIQRMSDFLDTHGLVENYQTFSAEKYGEKEKEKSNE